MDDHDEQGRVPETDAVEEYAADRRSDEGSQSEGAGPQAWDQAEGFQVVLETIRTKKVKNAM